MKFDIILNIVSELYSQMFAKWNIAWRLVIWILFMLKRTIIHHNFGSCAMQRIRIGCVANYKEHDAITNVKKLFILWNLPDLTIVMLLLLLLLRLQPTINNHIRHNCFLNHHLLCAYTICSGIWLFFLQITFQFDTFITKISS